ncbi:hypothetical protein GO730_04295 [Spirosoma sp. HMF3257]|uniref:DUF2254 domain-containing protein n=1 Tax=Spirosoma telluris TaxID=2183553 RepID=A0A327NG60_9BACT|nr:hypothetical protein [Spirosoma telluris]RAI73815.1 hypothetical protein HMF3257_04270 [Spirosoma telluris]
MDTSAKVLISEIIFDSSKEKYITDIENILNSSINKNETCKDYIKNICTKDNNPLIELKSLHSLCLKFISYSCYNSFIKLKFKKYPFINYETYKIDLSYLKLLDKNDIKIHINSLITKIDNDNIFELLNEILYADYIQKQILLLQKNPINKLKHFLIKISIKGFRITKSPFIIILLLLLFTFYIVTNNYIFITVRADTEQTISLSLIGALTSFLGFLVVFLQLSYDNLFKNFGPYAKKFVFNKSWNVLIIFFALSTAMSLISALLKDDFPLYQDLFFNISVISFVIFISLVIPKVKSILDKSTSLYYLKDIIQGINKKHIKELYVNSIEITDQFDNLSDLVERNPIIVITQINRTAIQQNSIYISGLILREITKRFDYLIKEVSLDNDNGPIQTTNQEIFLAYANFLYSTTETIYKSQVNVLIQEIYSSIPQISTTLALIESDGEIMQKLMELISDVVQESANSNDLKQVKEGILLYQNTSLFSLQYNAPIEQESINISSKIYNSIKAMHWNVMQQLITYKFNDLILYCISSQKGRNIIFIAEIAIIYSKVVYHILGHKTLGIEQKNRIISYLCNESVSIYDDFKNDFKANNIYLGNPFDTIIYNSENHNEKIFATIFYSWVNWYKIYFGNRNFRETTDFLSSSISQFILNEIYKLKSPTPKTFSNLYIKESLAIYYIIYNSYSNVDNILLSRAKHDILIIDNEYKSIQLKNKDISSTLRSLKKIYKIDNKKRS